jgi:hypothetical protein
LWDEIGNQKEQTHQKDHYLTGRYLQAMNEGTPEQDTSSSSTPSQGTGSTRKPADIQESPKDSDLPDLRDLPRNFFKLTYTSVRQ